MNRFVIIAISLLIAACQTRQSSKMDSSQKAFQTPDTTLVDPSIISQQKPKSPTAMKMDSLGLVDIEKELPGIFVDLMYAKPDNFVGRILYDDLTEAYLHPDAINALKKARDILMEEHPDLRLKVYDAARPMSIQKIMWRQVAGTSKSIYVSNPKNGGGMHNYGLAVDVTLCDIKGDTLAMGVLIDHLGRESNIDYENQMLKEGKLSQQAYDNRMILRSTMKKAGWQALRSEWWHFNLVDRKTAIRKYKVIP